MSDYISREAVREAVWQILNGMGYSEKHNDRLVEEVDAILDDIPAADVRPVVRGKWTLQWDGDGLWHCSECDSRCIYTSNFCPNCGADMREES